MTDFATSFTIAGRRVGADAPVLFIAEAGVAHFGDLEKADALIELAAAAKADVFKTQAFVTERLVSALSPEWRERLKSKEVDFAFLNRMKDRCERKNLLFMCTAHDEQALAWVDALDVPAYKIGSGERGNVPFLEKIGGRGKPVILSTGMYEESDVSEALRALAGGGATEVALLHCVTSYPVPSDQVNLRSMDSLRALFRGPVGYSDHTQGHEAVLAAVARGATIIEKHITLDFDIPNTQDWKVSAGPTDLPELVEKVRRTEILLGRNGKRVQECERAAFDWALKSLVATRDLAPGTILVLDMIAAKRPGRGLRPADLPMLLGRRLRAAVAADHPIRHEDLLP